MNIDNEIKAALIEKSAAKRDGRDVCYAEQRLQQLYKIPKKKPKKVKISIS